MAKRPRTVKCMFCERMFATEDAASDHELAKHPAEVMQELAGHGLQEGSGMAAADAIELADAMDLPDGAYFAMIGELMGADGEDAYMVGVEASLASGDYE